MALGSVSRIMPKFNLGNLGMRNVATRVARFAIPLAVASSHFACGEAAPDHALLGGKAPIDNGGIDLPSGNCHFKTGGEAVTEVDGLFFLECPISLTTLDAEGNPLSAPGLRAKNLFVKMGLDSTRISFDVPLIDEANGIDLTGQDIDINGDGTPDVTDPDSNGAWTFTMPQDIWYPGLVNTSHMDAAVLSLTPAERELYGFLGCNQDPYRILYHCPDDATSRAPVYLMGYELKAKYAFASNYTTLAIEAFMSPEDLYTDPTLVETGPAMNTWQIPFGLLIDKKAYAEDILDIQFVPKVVGDARAFKESAEHESVIRAEIVEE